MSRGAAQVFDDRAAPSPTPPSEKEGRAPLGQGDGFELAPRGPARYSSGLKSIEIDGGTRPSTSRGRTSVLSIARSTVSSQTAEPLLLVSFRLTMVPSGASRTSTVASGLPASCR